MLREVKELKGYKLGARDGDIGKVDEFYFDDRSWTIRYLVADTGNWLTGRQVLISPFTLDPAIKEERLIPVNLTRTQIEKSPTLETHVPVSRQFEMQFYPYYGLSTYWDGPFIGGSAAYPFLEAGAYSSMSRQTEDDDPHLRSTKDVSGRTIQAKDGELGHVADFVVDDETWIIRYLIVDTRNWWPGKKVLISTQWANRISWEESKVFISLSREAIRSGPEYLEGTLIQRDYEMKLHRHHGQEGYWAEELIPAHAR